jgi:DNA-binding NarL/FixJ family response regulator
MVGVGGEGGRECVTKFVLLRYGCLTKMGLEDLDSMPDLRVIVADDQLLVRAGIQHLLQEIGGFVCIATVPDGEQALRACADDTPDILLLDMHMPGPDGLSVTQQVLARHPGVHVVILSSDTSADLARRTLAAGARGYVSKDFVLDELAAALKAIASGRVYLSPDIALAAMHTEREPEVPLTPRQCDVLKGIAQGQSSKEIARVMGVSLKTVAYHRAELIQRLDLHDVASLTRFALRQGLLT